MNDYSCRVMVEMALDSFSHIFPNAGSKINSKTSFCAVLNKLMPLILVKGDINYECSSIQLVYVCSFLPKEVNVVDEK